MLNDVLCHGTATFCDTCTRMPILIFVTFGLLWHWNLLTMYIVWWFVKWGHVLWRVCCPLLCYVTAPSVHCQLRQKNKLAGVLFCYPGIWWANSCFGYFSWIYVRCSICCVCLYSFYFIFFVLLKPHLQMKRLYCIHRRKIPEPRILMRLKSRLFKESCLFKGQSL